MSKKNANFMRRLIGIVTQKLMTCFLLLILSSGSDEEEEQGEGNSTGVVVDEFTQVSMNLNSQQLHEAIQQLLDLGSVGDLVFAAIATISTANAVAWSTSARSTSAAVIASTAHSTGTSAGAPTSATRSTGVPDFAAPSSSDDAPKQCSVVVQ